MRKLYPNLGKLEDTLCLSRSIVGHYLIHKLKMVESKCLQLGIPLRLIKKVEVVDVNPRSGSVTVVDRNGVRMNYEGEAIFLCTGNEF